MTEVEHHSVKPDLGEENYLNIIWQKEMELERRLEQGRKEAERIIEDAKRQAEEIVNPAKKAHEVLRRSKKAEQAKQKEADQQKSLQEGANAVSAEVDEDERQVIEKLRQRAQRNMDNTVALILQKILP